MTIPNLEELENEVIINTASAFEETPLSKDSMKAWRLYYEKEGLILNDKELMQKIQGNPNPQEHDDVLQSRRIKSEIEEDHHSEFVQSIIDGIHNDMDGVINELEEEL